MTLKVIYYQLASLRCLTSSLKHIYYLYKRKGKLLYTVTQRNVGWLLISLPSSLKPICETVTHGTPDLYD